MAYDEGLAQRMRAALAVIPDIDEKKMFGGIGFLLNGNMACGVNKDDLIVRVGPDAYEMCLDETHTKEFDMPGRPMRGWGGGEACWVTRPMGAQRPGCSEVSDSALSLPPK